MQRLVFAFLIVIVTSTLLRADSVWVEGESCRKHNCVKHDWYDNVRKDGLSGKQWLSHYSKQRSADATFGIEVEGGRYVLWLRANPLLTRVAYRIGQGQWNQIDMRGDLRGEAVISPRPDHRNIAWINAGCPTRSRWRWSAGGRT